MRNFEGKTAVVTGAASGIGKALAEKFAQEKMQVVLADIEEEALEKTVDNLRQYQHRVIGIKTDVLIEESIDELFSKAKEEYGNIHILCNNAGIGANSGNKAIWEIDKHDWDWVMGVNYQGVLKGIQTFLPHMLEHGEEGHVVTTVSMAGLLPGAGTYGVSKHAVMALTEALSRDLITRNYLNQLLQIASLIVTVFWITGVTNAINWTDGLDGLAGGVSVVLSSGLFFIFLSLDLYDYALYAIAIAGACYGFLIHNYKPASILMGDGGSYFLGFNLASLSLIASNAIFFESEIGNAFFISLFPFLLLGVPIIDMFFVILIRIYNSKSPFYPDRNHLHHRLLSLGINYKGTISTILLLNITFVSLVYLFFSKREFIFISLTFYTLLLLSLNFLKKFLILK